jgi:hypothetical protein
METQDQPASVHVGGVSPSKKIRILFLLPILIASVLFWAPVGIITVFKMQSFAMIGPYWIALLSISAASLFVKKAPYWVIYSLLMTLTVLNAIGGLKFFGSMKGMH